MKKVTKAVFPVAGLSPRIFHHLSGFDCGSKLGYLKAIVSYGRKHPEVGQALEQFLETL